MYLAPDDAKTDVILAAAAAIFGVNLRGFVMTMPLYPTGRLVGGVIDIIWVFALTALVPLLLARHRGDGAAAFALSSQGLRRGWLLAVPAVFVGLATAFSGRGSPAASQLVMGRFAHAGFGASAAADLLLLAGQLVVFSAGALLLISFLAVRARQGFPRSPHVAMKQIVRTVGLGIVAVAVVTGVLRSIGPARGWVTALVITALYAAALLALVLLTDRRVPFGVTVPRAAITAPLVVVAIAHVFAAGGLFRGDLITGFFSAALAGGATLAIAALAQTRQGAAPAVWLVVAVHWWPTCLSPLSLTGGVC